MDWPKVGVGVGRVEEKAADRLYKSSAKKVTSSKFTSRVGRKERDN